jgi:hypothetical protein
MVGAQLTAALQSPDSARCYATTSVSLRRRRFAVIAAAKDLRV